MTGRVFAVTGGGRGIGAAIARAAVAAGDRVVIGDVDVDAARTVAGALGGAALALDVRDRGSFAAFLAGAVRAYGEPVDVLVNNAGIAPAGLFCETDPAVLDAVVDINLRGVLTGMRLALPTMLARGRGHVVNLASLAGRIPIGGAAVYAATKHAVVGLTGAVRSELRGSGVHLTAVLPTFTGTDMVAGLPLRGVPKARAEDVAAAVVRAVGRRRPPAYVTVPRHLTGIGPLHAGAPQWLRDLVLRRNGGWDVEARRPYEERVARLLGPD